MEKLFVTLYIASKIPGIVRVNNQILGDTASPLVASVSLCDIVYIEWHPIAPDYPSCFARLEFDGGELVEAPLPPYCRLFMYENNIFELEFSPHPLPAGSNVIPHIVCQRNYAYDKINYSASVYFDSGYVFCIENQYDFSIVFAQYINADLADAVIDLHFIAGSWFVCAHAKGSVVILKHSKTAELVYSGPGTLDFKDNALTIATRTDDLAGRQKIIQYGIKGGALGVRSYFTKMDLSRITSSEIAVHAFLFSIQNDLFDDAQYFLDAALASQTGEGDLKSYFGEFEMIRTHLHQNRIKSPNICIALFRQICENIYIAKTYYFEIAVLSDSYKIVNISE